MIPGQYLKAFAKENFKANTFLIKWLLSQPPELINKPVPSSFPGIWTTLLHIWDVEASWLADLKGEASSEDLLLSFNGTFPDLANGLLANSSQFSIFVQELTPTAFGEYCEYRRFDGVFERRLRAEIILHSMNHSTFHRGQIAAMGNILGMASSDSLKPW